VAESIDLLADRLTMAHAKDRTESGGFTAAGSGVLDYPHYIGCLRRAGFAGPLVTHGLTAAEAPEVGRFLARTLAAA
jgi:sugar phosphate isomerase/epimerase